MGKGLIHAIGRGRGYEERGGGRNVELLTDKGRGRGSSDAR